MSANLIEMLMAEAAKACDEHADLMRAAADALAQAEAQKSEAEHAQKWLGMDGATAFHLIERHANSWEQIGAEMEAWRAANSQPAAPAVPMSDSEVIARCEQAGIRWIPPDPDADDGGFPGGFDMTDMGAMRRMLESQPAAPAHPDCGLLLFSQMPEMKRDADGTIVVKCTEFRRDEELEEARRRVRESGLVTLAELTKRLEGVPEISGKVKGGRNG